MAVESKPPQDQNPAAQASYLLLSAQVTLFLPRQEPAKGIFLAMPIHSTSNCSRCHLALGCSSFYMLSTSTARELRRSFPGAAGGKHWPPEPGALAGKFCRKT